MFSFKFTIDLDLKYTSSLIWQVEVCFKYMMEVYFQYIWSILKVYSTLVRDVLLFKMRKYVGLKNIKIYFAIFDYYYSLPWAQNCSVIQQIVILRKRLLLELLIFKYVIYIYIYIYITRLLMKNRLFKT